MLNFHKCLTISAIFRRPFVDFKKAKSTSIVASIFVCMFYFVELFSKHSLTLDRLITLLLLPD